MSALIGMDAVINRLREIKARLGDMRAPLGESGVYMLRSIQENFAAQGRPSAWSALKASTMRSKGGRGGILVRSGRMRASNQVTITGSGWNIINTTPYSRFHITGTRRMAKRNFQVFQDADKVWVRDIFRKHIAG